MNIFKNIILIILSIFTLNALTVCESKVNKPNNTYFFDLYNIYVLEHSAKDLWTCDDKVTIYIEKEIYVTSATCSKSSNIITLTCDSHKDAYQFVSLPLNTIKTFNIKMSVGNETFTGTFNGNMTNLMSPQIVLINPKNGSQGNTTNSADEGKNSFNAYIVFMIAPTNTITNKAQVQLSYLNIVLLVVVIVAVLCSIVIVWITIWKLAQKDCWKRRSLGNKTKTKKRSTKVLYSDNNAWIDINELPSLKNLSVSCDNFNESKDDRKIKVRPQSSIIENRPKLRDQNITTFRPESFNSVYPV